MATVTLGPPALRTTPVHITVMRFLPHLVEPMHAGVIKLIDVLMVTASTGDMEVSLVRLGEYLVYPEPRH